jgi:uncharacterized protein (DUF736 family)
MEKRVNTGILFATKAKTNPKAPDYNGDLLIDLNSMEVKNGKVEVRIAGWKKQTKTGSVFLSLAVDKYEKKTQQKEESVQDMQDDDPF